MCEQLDVDSRGRDQKGRTGKGGKFQNKQECVAENRGEGRRVREKGQAKGGKGRARGESP